ncbi:hypothetical protein BN1088_1431973 [Sphingobacterium sp. PM2-P1-29]|nr:hypothetical protein BN1088_1431973 [Sphingobacterium sp. PM2-P1-29]
MKRPIINQEDREFMTRNEATRDKALWLNFYSLKLSKVLFSPLGKVMIKLFRKES